MKTESNLKIETYAGLFLVALATLMYEILLTRIFSVSMFYHFAFMAISIAMFGMTVGALIVYLLPEYFTPQKVLEHSASSALFFALTIIFGLGIHLRLPLFSVPPFFQFVLITITYIVAAVPFIFSGICVCLALTRFPGAIGRLYAVDLTGAAFGCILIIFTLKITDGLTAVFVAALFAVTASFFYARGAASYRRVVWARNIALFLFIFIVGNTINVHNQASLLRFRYVKGTIEACPLYEKWNSFSRIAVFGDKDALQFPLTPFPKQLILNIDASAATQMMAFDGKTQLYQNYFEKEVMNLAHHLRQNAKVLVIGTGGGRDVLSALCFKQRSVLGIEINENILHVVNDVFGSFTGHLDRNPKVCFVNDEARSYITRSKEKYDIIQASLIDTWAATAAGAFTLAENSLYTVEAWTVFLEHLTPDGILTFTRWYFRDNPGEMYRLTSLASASLIKTGVGDPRRHLIIVRSMHKNIPNSPDGLGTMLVSRTPFSDKDLDAIEKIVVNNPQWELVLTPRYSIDTTFAAIASGKDLLPFTKNFPLNIEPPTDDSPYFFNLLRLRDIFKKKLLSQGVVTFNLKAVYTLGVLLIVVIVLTVLCIIVPLILTTKKQDSKDMGRIFMFFGAIGFGFMFIEISQMQRFIVFLGQPSYGLSVLLFPLLISSGLGSYFTGKVNGTIKTQQGKVRLVLLLIILFFSGLLTPLLLNTFRGSTLWLRIFVAAGSLFPMGFFMGMAFPLGIRMAATRASAMTPWLWGINGAASVLASVLSVVVAMVAGISVTFWVGFSCYVVAGIMYISEKE